MARKRVKVRNGDKVKIHYTFRLDNGAIIGSSSKGEPFEFTLGKGEIIKGVEEAVRGMKTGQSRTVNITADKAYGPYHNEWVMDVGREKLPEDWNPEVGRQFEIPRENGQSSMATVTHVSQLSVTLDFNHPLAGKELIFEVSLLEIG